MKLNYLTATLLHNQIKGNSSTNKEQHTQRTIETQDPKHRHINMINMSDHDDKHAKVRAWIRDAQPDWNGEIQKILDAQSHEHM